MICYICTKSSTKMYNNNKPSSGFPDPLSSAGEKQQKAYGLRYAKAIESQWGKMEDRNLPPFRKQNKLIQEKQELR